MGDLDYSEVTDLLNLNMMQTNTTGTINKIVLDGQTYQISICDSVKASLSDEIIDEILSRLSPQFTALKCRECGGSIEQKYDDPIVKCPYCGTAYIIGRKRINET